MAAEQEIAAAAGALAWIDWGVVTGIVGTLLAIISYFWPRESIESRRDKLAKADPYRKRAAEALTGQDFGHVYCHALRRALILAWRLYGRRNGPLALGVSLWLALAYSWLLFWLIWGWLGPDEVKVAGAVLFAVSQESRVWLGPLVGASPIILTAVTWFGASLFRRWEDRLTKAWSMRGRLAYRIAVGGLAALTVLGAGLINSVLGGLMAVGAFASALLFLGALAAVKLVHTSLKSWVSVIFASAIGSLASVFANNVANDWIYSEFGVIIFAITVAIAVGYAGISVGFLGGVGALIALLVVEGFGILAFSLIVLATSSGILVAVPEEKRSSSIFSIVLFCVVGMIFSWGILYVLDDDFSNFTIGAFFFLLPLANGFADWGSWWVSRKLGSELRNRLRRPHTGREFAALVLRHGLYDFGLALGFFALLAILLAFAFESVDLLAAFKDIDVTQTIADAAENPFTDGLWLTAMLLSTLLPTAFHLLFLVASPLALLSRDREDREAWARDLQPAMFATLNDEQKFTLTTEVAEWQSKRHPARWAFAGMLTLGLFALAGWLIHLIATLATGEDRGFADLVAWVAGGGVWFARLLF